MDVKDCKISNFRSEAENHTKFKAAFNIEARYISNQCKMSNIRVEKFENIRYLPPKIKIESNYLKSQMRNTDKLRDTSLDKHIRMVRLKTPKVDFSRINASNWNQDFLQVRSLSPEPPHTSRIGRSRSPIKM